jgi:hypothetical protein
MRTLVRELALLRRLIWLIGSADELRDSVLADNCVQIPPDWR